MADSQSTQTHPEFQYRFLALGVSSQRIVHTIATTEHDARGRSPDDHVMVFAGRLPVQEVRYV